jgi:uncharacterized OB-fold protein
MASTEAISGFRPLPLVTPLTEPFWKGGLTGRLMLLRCSVCGYFTHPPGPCCARCFGRQVAFVPVSGRGHVYTFTVNHQPWYPGWPLPYVVALVQLEEQHDLRLFTNIVSCDPSSVAIGQRVDVTFLHVDDIALPVFRPSRET